MAFVSLSVVGKSTNRNSGKNIASRMRLRRNAAVSRQAAQTRKIERKPELESIPVVVSPVKPALVPSCQTLAHRDRELRQTQHQQQHQLAADLPLAKGIDRRQEKQGIGRRYLRMPEKSGPTSTEFATAPHTMSRR